MAGIGEVSTNAGSGSAAAARPVSAATPPPPPPPPPNPCGRGVVSRFGAALLVLLLAAAVLAAAGPGASAQSALPAQRTFVSNASQSTGSDVGWGHDFAQAFTTGSNSAGYSLHSVDLLVRSIASGFSSSWLTAAVHADSGGSPGSVVGTLDNPPIAANSNLHTLRFTSAGIDLDPGTTYWLVLDVSADASASRMVLTALTVEDAGALPGWSIGDVASARAWSSTGTFSPIGGGGFVLRVALGGTVKCPSMWAFSNAGRVGVLFG